jgi:hypothetical protein
VYFRLVAPTSSDSIDLVKEICIVDMECIWSDPDYRACTTTSGVVPFNSRRSTTIFLVHVLDYPNVGPSNNNVMVHSI